tara:strand:- start:222 stop:443 length:222 start_codon:yes stop_codon:yes gene_type:complete
MRATVDLNHNVFATFGVHQNEITNVHSVISYFLQKLKIISLHGLKVVLDYLGHVLFEVLFLLLSISLGGGVML